MVIRLIKLGSNGYKATASVDNAEGLVALANDIGISYKIVAATGCIAGLAIKLEDMIRKQAFLEIDGQEYFGIKEILKASGHEGEILPIHFDEPSPVKYIEGLDGLYALPRDLSRGEPLFICSNIDQIKKVIQVYLNDLNILGSTLASFYNVTVDPEEYGRRIFIKLTTIVEEDEERRWCPVFENPTCKDQRCYKIYKILKESEKRLKEYSRHPAITNEMIGLRDKILEEFCAYSGE